MRDGGNRSGVVCDLLRGKTGADAVRYAVWDTCVCGGIGRSRCGRVGLGGAENGEGVESVVGELTPNIGGADAGSGMVHLTPSGRDRCCG